VAQGTWCPACARNTPLGLPHLREVAANRGGECLSPKYLNSGTALWWRCAERHEWKATPCKVKRGSWCPVCAHTRRRSKWIPGKIDRIVESNRTTPRIKRQRGGIRRRQLRVQTKLLKYHPRRRR
jgi:hypothetical protein